MSSPFQLLKLFFPFILLFACSSRPDTASDEVTATVEKPSSEAIEVTAPQPGAYITSPLQVTGRARGIWFFEANFPMKLVDLNGYLLATGYAEAEGDWMTEDFVSFTGTLDFSGSDPDRGFLVLNRANPSGLAEHADSLRIAVDFNPPR